MSDYEKSLEYLREMKKPGNTILGVNHDHIPKYFPMEQKEGESRSLYGLKGLAAGGLTGGLFARAVHASGIGSPAHMKQNMILGAGVGATAGLARNLIEHGRKTNGREKNKRQEAKKKK